jgi:hypothetical protein
MSGIPYSASEIEWLQKNNSQFKTTQELYNAFCRIFPFRGLEGFKTKIWKLKLTRPNKGSFKYRKRKDLPIGTERMGQNGVCYVKVANNYGGERNRGYKPPYWLPKQRKIYEEVFGKIPDGYMVVFLNRDTTDFSIENLYCTNRKILAIMNRYGWFSSNREQTLTAIKLCELWEELKRTKGV